MWIMTWHACGNRTMLDINLYIYNLHVFLAVFCDNYYVVFGG